MIFVATLYAYASTSPRARRVIKAVALLALACAIALLVASCAPAQAHHGAQPWHNAPESKDLVCDDTFSEAVATPTDKRGFVSPKFWGLVRRHRPATVSGGMGKRATCAARLRTCHQHPAHLLRVMTQTVALVTPEGAKTMTATTRAATTPTPTPAIPADHLQHILAAFNAANLASSYIERGNIAAARRKLVQALAAVNHVQEGGRA